MKYMYLGQLLQGDVQLVLHVLHLLLKIADLHKYCKSCQIFLILVKYLSNTPLQ